MRFAALTLTLLALAAPAEIAGNAVDTAAAKNAQLSVDANAAEAAFARSEGTKAHDCGKCNGTSCKTERLNREVSSYSPGRPAYKEHHD
ncbi:hypothetical protein BDW74DRAFT_183062 [Aspergillus multicolor]|uniref:uncharacterized protein n=1 Tax=Aspergillus multicolor TaxID=41759 RepID=UPI003CCD4F6F